MTSWWRIAVLDWINGRSRRRASHNEAVTDVARSASLPEEAFLTATHHFRSKVEHNVPPTTILSMQFTPRPALIQSCHGQPAMRESITRAPVTSHVEAGEEDFRGVDRLPRGC